MLREFAASTLVISLIAAVAGGAGPALADASYKGKTVRVIVGWAAGGGFDAYARMIGRRLGDHLPGKPTVIVENMTGAGSVKAANYMYNVATANGLILGSFTSDLPLLQALGERGLKVDTRKFNWVGAAFKATFACAVMGSAGVGSWKDIKESKKMIRMGANRRGSNMFVVPSLLNQTAGTNFKMVVGYRGTSQITLALRTKELDGACWNWMSMKVRSGSMLKAKGDAKLIPFTVSRRLDDPMVKGLPLIHELISEPDTRAAYEKYILVDEMPGPYALPPGTPQDYVDAMRAAFKATLNDPKLLDDAKRARVEFNYVSPDEMNHYVNELFSAPDKVKKVIRTMIGLKS
jgi:tripartite-type tricarboxylate transporter receptor subunit TctC